MALWSELRAIIRWLLRRPDPPPPPGYGKRVQAAEQDAARQRLLGQAQAERLRNSRWYTEPTQPNAYVPLTLGQRTGYQVRCDR
ncbi:MULTISPECIES: hypothetical protein [unclassified Micromonospora]|uniref:hypothetical protein n=1 Tax=unclassified Micromonospora TaxID=2617518 RepID=UPI003628EEE0